MEVVSVACLYITLFVILSIIYIFTGSDKLSVDFILNLNKTGKIEVST